MDAGGVCGEPGVHPVKQRSSGGAILIGLGPISRPRPSTPHPVPVMPAIQDIHSVQEIRSLYIDYGAGLYGGEAVTQLEHALQAATLAEAAGATDTLIAAAFLHDLGHILEARDKSRDPAMPTIDHRHQLAVVPYIHHLFPDAVIEPIKMHVDAKRCLCAIDDGYFSTLSPSSVHSLSLQGGIYSQAQAEQFRARPHAEAALRLRRWDDQAKVENLSTPDVDHFMRYLETVSQRDRPRP